MSEFKAKMHQIQFRLRSAPHPAGGAYSAPPDPLAGFNGPTSKAREGKGWEWMGKGKGREGKEKGREGGKGKGGKEEKGGRLLRWSPVLTKILGLHGTEHSKSDFFVFWIKVNSYRIRSTTEFLCVKTSSGKVVVRTFPYLTVFGYWWHSALKG